MANRLIDYPNQTYTKTPEPPITTVGDAFSAQYGKVLAPIIEENRFYTAPEYDEGAASEVEKSIELRPWLTENEKLRLRNFGTSYKAIQDNLNYIDAQRARMETISNLSGPLAFVSDPYFGVDLTLMLIGVGGPAALSRMFGAVGFKTAKQGLKQTTRRVTTGQGIGYQEAAKIGAFYGGAAPTVLGTLETLSAEDDEEALKRAGRTILETLGFSALGAVAGGGITAAIGAKRYSDIPLDNSSMLNADEIAEAKLKRSIENTKKPKSEKEPMTVARKKRNKALSENYKQYLDDVSGDEVPVETGFKNEKLFKLITGAVPTPLRSIINSNLPDSFKSAAMKLGADMGFITKANEAGVPSEISVHLKKALRSREWSTALSKIDGAYQEVNPRRSQQFMGTQVLNSVEKVRRFIGKESYTLEDWYELVGKTSLRNTPIDQIGSEPLKNAVVAYREFMKPHTDELESLGIINSKELFVEKTLNAAGRKGELIAVTNKIIDANKRWMAPQVDRLLKKGNRLTEVESQRLSYLQGLQNDIANVKTYDELMALRPKLDLTPKMAEALKKLKGSIDDLAEQIDSYRDYIEAIDPAKMDRVHFPIVYNRNAIRNNRQGFEAIVRKEFMDNPTVTVFNEETNRFDKVTLSTNPTDVAERARKAVDTILGETDEDDIEMMFSGIGRSGMLAARRMNIPAEKMEEFIVTDIRDIMIAYSDRVGGRIDFYKTFANPETGKAQAIDDILEQLRMAARSEGATEKEVEEGIMNFVAMYDMVVGTPLKNPDALDNKIAQALSSVTNLTFLGRAGVAAIGDASTIFMDNDLATIGKVFLSPLSDEKPLSKNAKELRQMGDLFELARGMAHIRFMEGMSRSPFVKSTWDKVNNAFYNLNGLNFVTMATKNIEGLARSHTVIERSIKLAEGKATKYETEFLARYGIDKATAKEIANRPFEKTKNDLIMANSSQWADDEIKDKFQTAVRAGIANRIIMGTPADKPKMMNGVAYFRKETAQKFGLPMIEDPRVPGYVRYESGLMTIPFAFYTYTFGALTKITGNYAQGAVNNKAAHIAAALVLGGLIVKVRTPSWAWDDMDTEDKVARALDFSGLAALHTDLAYRALAMANEFGVDVESFPIEPKFDSGVDPYGAGLSIFGAPVDYVYGLGTAIKDMTEGNMSEGAKGLINHIPLIGAMAFFGTIKDTLKSIVPSD